MLLPQLRALAPPGCWLLQTLAIVVLPLVQSCDRRGPESEESEVPTWSISQLPDVVIGTEGDPRYEFFGVSAGVLLDDGGVIVADAGSSELRFYDAQGRYLKTLGGRGAGPGEFQNIAAMSVYGDTVVVAERSFPNIARVHWFHADSGLLATVPIRPGDFTPGRVSPRKFLSPNAVVVTEGGSFRAVDPPPEGTVVRDSVTYGILSFAPNPGVEWIGTFAHNSFYSFALPAGMPAARSAGIFTLGPSLIMATSPGQLWIGDSGSGVIRRYDTLGMMTGEIPYPDPPRLFSDSALQAAKELATAELGSVGPDLVDQMYSDRLRPSVAPLFSRMRAGPNGELWVESYMELDGEEHQALVFDRHGRLVARTWIPKGLAVRDVSHDRVLGTQTNHDGIERVVVHSLRR